MHSSTFPPHPSIHPSIDPFIHCCWSWFFSIVLLYWYWINFVLFFLFVFCLFTYLLLVSVFFSFILLLQGICPGNRLKVISSYEATSYKPSPVSSPCPSMPSFYYNNSILSSADSILYENTVGCVAATSPNHQKFHGKRRSWHIMPNKVLYYHYFIYQSFQ